MTTISIPGKITGIDYKSDFLITTLVVDTTNNNSTAVIEPSGAVVTIILIDSSALSGLGEGVYVSMSSDFNIGDVVEVYSKAGVGSLGANLNDENGNSLASIGGTNPGAILRKISTGSGQNWVWVS